MTLAYWMILACAMLPYLTVAVAKYRPDYDNASPRAQLAAAEGARLRAYWAHLNHFEAFPPFAAAVIIAHLAQARQDWVDILAVAFVVLRVLYAVLYVADRPTARSLVWSAAFFCMVGLFVAAAIG
ncbi:MAG: MAPEG family protein [Rhodocyclaceae bacterium]|nr:MAPEG family protein [Rhodocyclaceae bacterium]MCE2979301.1 MAPEG family protein [Betaproteobacteria bacterium]MCA3073878.1 MAPEG family protein [Rhodocyclaceae bacterium]MCA3089249.1 MAPEG family protein [Rhodocyclaceae bacterium]MCA3092810.1 MAPEG family protein [Rhodocyclaceae bacterium]